MSDIWVPGDPSEAEWVMKIEAAKFEKAQLEAETAGLLVKLECTRTMIDRVKQNLEFLSSRKAKIILILEFRNARRNLAALLNEERSIVRLLDQAGEESRQLVRKIENLETEAAKAGKVLRFKRDSEEGEGSQD